MSLLIATEYSDDLKTVIGNGKIHSVFDKSINVKTDTGELFTLVSSDIFHGSRQIRIETTSFKQLNVSVGQEVLLDSKSTLKIGNDLVSIKESQIFLVKLAEFPKVLPENMSTLVNEVNDYLHATLDTVGYYRKSFSNEMEKMVHQWLTEKSEHLIDFILKKNWNGMFKEISSLVGLGSGLTPSGDDILTGFSLVINSQHFPNLAIQENFNKAIIQVKGETNFISQKQLEFSLEGKSLHPVIKVIEAFYKGESFESLIKLVKEVLTIGSSSGSDILAGILIGLRMVVLF